MEIRHELGKRKAAPRVYLVRLTHPPSFALFFKVFPESLERKSAGLDGLKSLLSYGHRLGFPRFNTDGLARHC